MAIVPGPDFPTGGQILGRNGIYSAYTTGNGSVMMRAKASFEEIREGRHAIVIHEVPYQVNKGRLLERLGEVAREKIVEGIAAVRDESDRDGVRVVVEMQRGQQGEVVLNQLFKYTPLQTSFGCNMVALNLGRPQILILRDFIYHFLKFREEVITRRTIFELNKARDRAHILAGLAVAVANIDDIIALIRNASDPQSAREELMAKEWPATEVAALIELIDDPEHPLSDKGTYQLSEIQARAILDLRLHRLTGLERDKIADDLKEITDQIAELLSILASKEKMFDVMREELRDVRARFATPRRTELVDAEFETDIEDLIQREDMVVTVTNDGYVKRTPLDTYRAQRRGGKGRSGMNMKDEDFVSDLFVASTHTPILFFTSRGLVHRMKVYQLPLGTPQSRGKAVINLLPMEKDEVVNVYMRLPEDEEVWNDLDLMFATSHGSVRRNKLSDFKNIRSNGLIAMKLGEGESLVSVKICKEDEDIMLATRKGKAIRFNVDAIRLFSGRTSTGVRGIRLGKGDEVIGMSVLRREAEDEKGQAILCVSENGFGKRTYASEYRTIGRGGQGVINMSVTEKTGEVIATFPVTDDHQVMLVTDQGKLIRTPIRDVRFTGRSAQGVTIFKVGKDEKVVSVAWLIEDNDDEEEVLGEDGEVIEAAANEEVAEVSDEETPSDEGSSNEEE